MVNIFFGNNHKEVYMSKTKTGIQTYYQQYKEYRSSTINPISFSEWLLDLVRNMRGALK